MAGIFSGSGRRLAFALALLASSAGRAEEIGESADDPSAFSTVLEARDYDERFATVEDLLERAPGVRVRRFGGLGAHSTASIRGAKAEQVLVLIDGVRIASTESGSFDFSTLPLREIERVEILRGGGSARYGSNALGGVISITTRRPEGPEPSADLALAGGSHDTLGGDVSLAAGGDRFRGLASYTRLRSENDFEFEYGGDAHERVNADFVDQGGLLRSELALGRGSQLDAMLWLHDRDAGQPGSVQSHPLPDISDDVLSCATADEEKTRGLARLAWRGELGREGGLEIAGFHRREGSWLDDPAGACRLMSITGERTHSRLRESASGLELLANASELDLGPLWLSLRGSASLHHDGVTSNDTQPQRRTSGAFSLLADAEVLDRRLRVLPALGFESARTSDGLARNAAFLAFEPVSLRDESVWLPGIGVIAELAPGLRAKANWKRAFRRPSFAELFHPDGYIRGNPELRSERATNADIGLELAAERIGALRDLFVQIAAFQRDIDESIEWMFTPANVYMPFNTGSARVDGIELSASLELFERLELELGHTWTDARLTDTPPCLSAFCNPVHPIFPHVPRRAGFARTELLLGEVRVYTELRYESEVGFQVGRQETADAALQIDAGLSLHPYVLPGLRSLPRGLSFSLDAVNLGREQRIDSLGQPLPRETLVFVRIRAVTP